MFVKGVLVSSYPSVYLRISAALTGRISVIFDIGNVCKYPPRNSIFS
jgi:hypothetical protein